MIYILFNICTYNIYIGKLYVLIGIGLKRESGGVFVRTSWDFISMSALDLHIRIFIIAGLYAQTS